ncbi:FAD-dependent oxidoreductase [Lewinella cohaerens]|uniref:FAD-dependent oxidoreductase n=1 Tax=Lewinella cohaerens TaxID=70995 RepID=UPI00035C5355|nr:NAD(P)/FAD-dependent oxidoreductase [Lewinella cohaerens]
MSNKEHKVIIIGAGLCGTLLGIRLAQKGYTVELYEKRTDLRLTTEEGGRSINLALSHRGLMALDTAGMREEVLKYCIPMRGRMIHSIGQDARFSSYSGREDEYINSVSRSGLNRTLLEKADTYDNLQVFFEHSCTSADIENATATFQRADGTLVKVAGTVLIGTDGAGSVVRRAMMSRSSRLLFNFSQHFLRSGYKELTIPPAPDGGYRIDSNALHIWPRGAYMTIALPNMDGSFTVTMFHPYDGEAGFNTLDTFAKVKSFFEEHYPSLLPHLIGLQEDYFDNPVGTLGTIKCYPWQAYGKTLVMGDAAHAIVPFYGQGMNAAFEDVRIFIETLEQHGEDWAATLEAFSEERPANTDAIADLAIDNFYEMQDKVDDTDFIKKRSLEMALEDQFPDYYSKYSLVTFKPELSYAEAMVKGRQQDEFLLKLVADKEVEDLDLEEVLREVKENK